MIDIVLHHYLALDLKDDPRLIEAYKQYHQPGGIWPEITQSIRDAGILNMEIYQTGNRLFMVMTVSADFSFQNKAKADNENPKVQEWEALMSSFQKSLPGTKAGEKWQRLDRIFNLNDCD